MATYKLNYFGITGLGEPIRMAFALAGIPFENNTQTMDAWKAMKEQPKYANCQMPLLEITNKDGTEVMLSQSRAILRYVGGIGKFNGKFLYPNDPMERYHCDEAIECVEDVRPLFLPTFAIADQAEKEAARAALVKPDGKMYKGLEKINDRLAKFDFCAGKNPTVADCYVVAVLFNFQAPSFLDGFPADTFAPFPNITALKDRLCALKPLQAYYANAEGIRVPFKVAAPEKKDKKGKSDAPAAPLSAEELAEARKKQLKKVIKEGGKRGVEIEGAADMGGLQFFCTSVDEPDGDLELAEECMKAMNVKSDPTEEERKGGSGHIGKMIFSAGTEQLAVVAYVPEEKQSELSCEEWLKAVLAIFSGEVVSASASVSVGKVAANSDKNVFPLKIREPMILEANNFLRKKGLFPEDNGDSDDEMVFGDDDFPS